jgi:hypothetical protein
VRKTIIILPRTEIGKRHRRGGEPYPDDHDILNFCRHIERWMRRTVRWKMDKVFIIRMMQTRLRTSCGFASQQLKSLNSITYLYFLIFHLHTGYDECKRDLSSRMSSSFSWARFNLILSYRWWRLNPFHPAGGN